VSESAIEDVGLELPVNDAMLEIRKPSRIAAEAGLEVRRQAPPSPAVFPVELRHEALQEPGAESFTG
jgi:hypothetical protein